MKVLLVVVFALILLVCASLQEGEDAGVVVLSDPVASQHADVFTTTTALEGEAEEQATILYGKAVKLGLRFISSDDATFLQEAQSTIERAIQLQPAFADAKIVKALIHILKKDYSKAKEQLKETIKSSPSLKPEATAILGYTEEFSGNRQAAVTQQLPLYYNITAHHNKQYTDTPTTQLLVDNYFFAPNWVHTHTYNNYINYMPKLVVFNELYKRQQTTNWDATNEFSWKTYGADNIDTTDADDEDAKLRKAALKTSISYRATLRGGPNVDINRGNMTEARKIFKKDAIQLRGVLQPAETKLLWDYYHEMVLRGNIQLDDYLNRYMCNNDRIGYYLLHKFKNFAEALAGEPLKPAYTFLSYYQNPIKKPDSHANLRPHTDKADNYVTFSFQLKVNPVDSQNVGELVWPLWVYTGLVEPVSSWHDRPNLAESVSFNLVEGDAIVFKGRTHIHWRDNMPDHISNCTTMLLHYIPLDFDYEGFSKAGRSGY